MMEVSPLSLILVKSDSKGDRLLFRYPYHIQESDECASTQRKNPYTLPTTEDPLQSAQLTSNIIKGYLTGFSDEVLSSLFAVKIELCDKNFELKVNDVRFVGFPTQIPLMKKLKDGSGYMLINMIIALHAVASPSVVQCYHEVSKKMGIALRFEEKRCGYASEQTQLMTASHDEGFQNTKEAFNIILEKCSLARNIKKMYYDLCGTGLVNVYINRWIPLSYCLPQKAHQWHLQGKIVEPEDIYKCLSALRPYHSMLLLYPVSDLHDFIPLDGSPTLIRLLSQYSPLKNLQTLSADSDITLNHVFELTAHLFYWAKATIIFPICSANKYVISPDAPVHRDSPLVEKFSEEFPGYNLLQVISEYSLPTSLGQKYNPLCHPSEQSHLVKTLIWMLQHHLLIQLHTYIQYMPLDNMAKPAGESLKLQNTPNPELESGPSTVPDTPDPRSEVDQPRMMNFSDLTFISLDDEKQEYQEELLLDFPDEERSSIFRIPATNNPEDLRLFAKLCRKKYFQGEHHIEEIMYHENLRRSQVLQLLDKFRDVLLTYETEDPSISMFSSFDW
ncbi:hypothetical protein WA026_012214 [Henosepilachna vigintioctopunctata]|uniref:GATOR complex protein NPRL3 n=1 Tax=Henosepilachna vigintioctopunctata TaxID=420089 RepID=A0AAW1VF57_9CUCU